MFERSKRLGRAHLRNAEARRALSRYARLAMLHDAAVILSTRHDF